MVLDSPSKPLLRMSSEVGAVSVRWIRAFFLGGARPSSNVFSWIFFYREERRRMELPLGPTDFGEDSSLTLTNVTALPDSVVSYRTSTPSISSKESTAASWKPENTFVLRTGLHPEMLAEFSSSQLSWRPSG